MTDFLDEKRKEIDLRLKELAPLVEEYHRLEAGAAALSGVSGPKLRAARTPARASSGVARRRRGRPRGQGGRALQAMELIAKRPGIKIPEIAAAMGIKQNYLYRVLPPLEKDGKITKRDGGWHPAG
ncbi:MAG: hypothetical protein ACR2ND_04605 [Solirubrobacteraceae bacterium]